MCNRGRGGSGCPFWAGSARISTGTGVRRHRLGAAARWAGRGATSAIRLPWLPRRPVPGDFARLRRAAPDSTTGSSGGPAIPGARVVDVTPSACGGPRTKGCSPAGSSVSSTRRRGPGSLSRGRVRIVSPSWVRFRPRGRSPCGAGSRAGRDPLSGAAGRPGPRRGAVGGVHAAKRRPRWTVSDLTAPRIGIGSSSSWGTTGEDGRCDLHYSCPWQSLLVESRPVWASR